MKRIVPFVILLAGCTAVGAGERDDRAGPDGEPRSWSGAELATLPPVTPPSPASPEKAMAGGGVLPDLAAVLADGKVIRVRNGRVVDDGRIARGLVGLDRTTLVEAVTDGKAVAPGDDASEIRWADLFTGATTGRVVVPGAQMVPTVTDTSGRYAALVNAGTAPQDGTIAAGRATSTIVIADRDAGERYRTTLDGNFHPEAFGTPAVPDGAPDTVYLLEYLPADAPTHYRVRVLHTSTGEVGLPVNLRDKTSEVDAEMAGQSRTQVVSDHAGGLLFTLYRGVAGEGDRHGYAFVHTLGLGGGVWCLDIPPQMELDAQPGAVVVAGDHLVVASANGTVGSYDIEAVLDPARAPVMGEVHEYLHPVGDPVLAATDDRVWVGWGNFVYELDPATLEMLASAPRQLDRPVTALAATADGLLIAHPDGTIVSSGGAATDLSPGDDDDDAADDVVALVVDDR